MKGDTVVRSLLEQAHVHPTAWAVVLIASLIGAAIDVRTRRIPNALTGPLLLAGLVYAAAFGRGAMDGVAGMLVAGLPFFVFWLLRGYGAGDAKMMMALGAWVGAAGGTVTVLCVALTGGVVALAYALARWQLFAVASNMLITVGGAVFLMRGGGRFADRQDAMPKYAGKEGIPYGLAIALGTALAAGLVWGKTW